MLELFTQLFSFNKIIFKFVSRLNF